MKASVKEATDTATEQGLTFMTALKNAAKTAAAALIVKKVSDWYRK